MGYLNIAEPYKPSMDVSRFSSAGPSPITSGGFSEPKGLFKETPGTFSVPKGMFMPEGSKQQDKAIAKGMMRDLPTALNPDTPPVKSAMAPLSLGQPDMLMNKKTGRMSGWLGADMSLSPFLSQPGFSIDLLRSGGLGML